MAWQASYRTTSGACGFSSTNRGHIRRGHTRPSRGLLSGAFLYSGREVRGGRRTERARLARPPHQDNRPRASDGILCRHALTRLSHGGARRARKELLAYPRQRPQIPHRPALRRRIRPTVRPIVESSPASGDVHRRREPAGPRWEESHRALLGHNRNRTRTVREPHGQPLRPRPHEDARLY